MGGDLVPEEWKGGIKNISYALGGVMNPPEFKVRLSLTTILALRRVPTS